MDGGRRPRVLTRAAAVEAMVQALGPEPTS